MKDSLDQRRPFGNTGLLVPPLVFGTAALGNGDRVIPDQTKLAICGEWFRQIEPPVFIDVADQLGRGEAVEILVRMLRQLDVARDEVTVQLALCGNSSSDQILERWQKACQQLGEPYRPKLVSIGEMNEGEWRALNALKTAGEVKGVGLATDNFVEASTIDPPPDWFTLTGGFTVMRHPSETLLFVADMANRQIPVIVAGAFEDGFLVGENRLDGRALDADDSADRSILAWRKAFVALCQGHGITPAHACIQFALSAPSVVAVLLDSSYPDRVAENVRSVCEKVPEAFWSSMKEEGLFAADYPLFL